MRTENIKVKITIPIPFDRPDLNGVSYSKEAIERMTQQMHINNPIVFRTNEEDNPKVIGHTTGNFQEEDFDYENGVCKFTINGIIYYGGMDIVVNKFHKDENGVAVIDDFRITGIGFSL